MIEFDMLKKINFFEKFSDEILEKITPLLQTRAYASNEVIFNQDESSERIYMVIEGDVALHCTVEDGRVLSLDKVSKGETMGLASLLPNTFTRFSAISINNSRLGIFDSSDMLDLFSKNYKLGYAIMSHVVIWFKRKTDIRTNQLVDHFRRHPLLNV